MDFKLELEKLNISLSDEHLKKFETYFKFLVEYNENVNLTAITEHDEVYLKHFYDSLLLSKAYDFKDNTLLCDVGAGAGFPSIPNAIYFNNLNVTIVDALNKRITFLNELKNKLNLTNVSAIHQRAEEHANKNRETYDVVTARAVARLAVLAELCLPLVKVDGYFLAMKSQDTDDELKEASKAITVLGGKLEKIFEFELPDGAGKRTILKIKKVKNTPNKYPRAFAKIKSSIIK